MLILLTVRSPQIVVQVREPALIPLDQPLQHSQPLLNHQTGATAEPVQPDVRFVDELLNAQDPNEIPELETQDGISIISTRVMDEAGKYLNLI